MPEAVHQTLSRIERVHREQDSLSVEVAAHIRQFATQLERLDIAQLDAEFIREVGRMAVENLRNAARRIDSERERSSATAIAWADAVRMFYDDGESRHGDGEWADPNN